jgi:uncharacterized protein
MYIDLSQFEENELRIEYRYDERFDLQGSGVRLVKGPALKCRLRRAAAQGEFRLDGRVVAGIEAECDRCLTLYTIPIDISFEVYYAPIERLTQAEEVPLSQQDLVYGFYRDHLIDVDTLVREQLLLALPFRRLCREDCLGLCPHCGADLNRGACFCPQTIGDPRWEGLLSLKKELQ